MRTSPRPTFPDLNSNWIEPDRPVASLEYSPSHVPESDETSDFAPPTATVGAGLELEEEHAGTPSASGLSG